MSSIDKETLSLDQVCTLTQKCKRLIIRRTIPYGRCILSQVFEEFFSTILQYSLYFVRFYLFLKQP